MTVLFAFAWPEKRACFIGADDREGHAGARCDKVLYVHGRFFVGAVGNNIVLDAVRLTTALGPDKTCLRDGTEYRCPDSVAAFCALVARALAIVTPVRAGWMDAAVARGERTAAQRDDLFRQHATLVVADRAVSALWLVTFGRILPARNAYRFTLSQLNNGRVHRVGIDDPVEIGGVSKEMLERPFRWCAGVLADAIVYLDGKNMPGILGDLGACYLARGSSVHAHTAFESIDAAMKSFYP